jgi:hypothetical protein
LGAVIYSLCAITSASCSWLLLRAFRSSRVSLLLWSAACFGLLAVNNVLVAIDLLIFPSVDLLILRNGTALLAVGAMLYGLIWNAR